MIQTSIRGASRRCDLDSAESVLEAMDMVSRLETSARGFDCSSGEPRVTRPTLRGPTFDPQRVFKQKSYHILPKLSHGSSPKKGTISSKLGIFGTRNLYNFNRDPVHK